MSIDDISIAIVENKPLAAFLILASAAGVLYAVSSKLRDWFRFGLTKLAGWLNRHLDCAPGPDNLT